MSSSRPIRRRREGALPLGIAKDAGEFKEKVEPFFVYYIRNLILDNADGQFDALDGGGSSACTRSTRED